MGKILAIDYGLKRVGLAITDETNVFAFALDTVASNEIYQYIDKLLLKENISTIVIGEPKDLKNQATDATKPSETIAKKLKAKYPAIIVERVDERFTSKMAFQAMLDGGMKKKERRNKGNIDKISATIILQSYLETQNNNFKL